MLILLQNQSENYTFSNCFLSNYKLWKLVREGFQIKKVWNLGHCPNRREGGLKNCPIVPTLILNQNFNIMFVSNSINVVQLNHHHQPSPFSPHHLFFLFKILLYQKTAFLKFKLVSQVLGEGGRSGRLGQCPKFNRFSILQPSLISFENVCTPMTLLEPSRD